MARRRTNVIHGTSDEVTIDADSFNIGQVIREQGSEEVQDTISYVQNIKDNETEMVNIISVWQTERQAEMELKKKLSWTLVWIMIVQVIFLNVMFQEIGFQYKGFRLNEWTVRLIVTGIFLEIIGIVKIIVNSLFPKNSSKDMLNFVEKVYSKD